MAVPGKRRTPARARKTTLPTNVIPFPTDRIVRRVDHSEAHALLVEFTLGDPCVRARLRLPYGMRFVRAGRNTRPDGAGGE